MENSEKSGLEAVNKSRKNFSDTQIYRSICVLLSDYMKIYTQMEKSLKFSFGEKVMDKIALMTQIMVESYLSSEVDFKYHKSVDCLRFLGVVEIFIKMLSEGNIKVISVKQCGLLMKDIAVIKIQLRKRNEALAKKIWNIKQINT
mgnify:CR=1 FL=1